MEIEKAVGLALRRARESRGVSQRELSRLSQVSRSFLADVENGRGQPTIPTLKRLTDELNMSLVELVGEIESLLDEGEEPTAA
jgi:transcriptional regulator with XRE-family HTH domain